MIKAAIVGSINYDCVAKGDRLPKLGETVRGISFGTFVGGKGANQAVQLSRLGANVTFIGKIGSDEVGQTLKNSLKSNGVCIDYLTVDNTVNSGACSINLDSEGHNTLLYVPGANERFTAADIDSAAEAIKAADIFITQNEINLDMLVYGLKTAKKYGVRTVLNPAPALELPSEVFALADYIVPNETEAEVYTGITIKDDPEVLKETAGWFLSRGTNNVVITMGEKGAFYYDGNTALRLTAYKIKAADTTAAGDAYIGGFSFIIGQGGDIEEAMKFGNACGALAASKNGAQVSLSTYAELIEFIKNNPK